MMKQLVIICIIILGASGSMAMLQDDAPEDVWFKAMFQKLGEHPDTVVEELSKIAPNHAPELQKILNRVTTTDNETMPDNSTVCVGCQLVITAGSYLMKMGYTVDDIQPGAITLCKALFFLMNAPYSKPGEMVCPGVINNFGHHVERILTYNRNLPEDSCHFLTMCTNNKATIQLPPLSDLIDPFANQRWKIPTKKQTNYKIEARLTRKRDWHNDEDIFRVAQFTDIHVDQQYAEGSFTECGMPLCCRELPAGWRPGQGSAGPNGEYVCNVPPSTTRLFLEKAKSFNPDIVLYSGDSPSHHIWAETLDGQTNSTFWVAQELNNYFPDVIGIYAALGNHECFPTNMYYPPHEDTQAVHDTFIGAYQELSSFGEEQIETFSKAGYYSVQIAEGLRIVAPNSNFGYTDNWYNLLHLHNSLYTDMVAWMDATLEKARQDGEKVIILTHHPVQGSVRGYDENFSEQMVKFSDIIILNVVGHKHKDEFRIFRDTSGAAKGVQFLAQSANSYSNVNPGVRVYFHDKNTYELLGYEQYYLDISQREGTAEVKLLYKTDEGYSLENLSPESMLNFAARMDADNELFEKFYSNIVTGAGTQEECDEACKKEILCRQVTSNRGDMERCLSGDEPTPTDTPTVPVPTPSPTDSASSFSINPLGFILPIILLITML